MKQFDKYNKIIIIQRKNVNVNGYQDGLKISFETRSSDKDGQIRITTLFKAKVARNIKDINFSNKEHIFFITNDIEKINDLLIQATSFSSALGPKGLKNISKYFKKVSFDNEKNFYPFENDVNSIDDFFEMIPKKQLTRIDVMADRICTIVKHLKSTIYVKTEYYKATVIREYNDKVGKEVDKDIYRTKFESAESYEYYKARKFYLVNGSHMILAINIYEYITKKNIPLKKAKTYELSPFLDIPEIRKSLDEVIQIQSLRILCKYNEPLGKSNDEEYTDLLDYGQIALKRFDNPIDVLERVLDLNVEDIKNRKLKLHDRFLVLLDLISKDKNELVRLGILDEEKINSNIISILEINKKIISILLTEITEKDYEIQELICFDLSMYIA